MDIATEVLALFAEYESAIINQDDVKIAGLISFPFEVIVKDGKKHYYDSQAQMMARLQTFRGIHQKLRIASILRDVEKIHKTHEDEALILVLDTALDANKEVIASWKTTFFVKRTASGTKLVKADSTDQNRAMTELGFPLYQAKSVSLS